VRGPNWRTVTEVEELRQLMKLAVDVAEWLETLNGGTA
jgi:hypothetical protein